MCFVGRRCLLTPLIRKPNGYITHKMKDKMKVGLNNIIVRLSETPHCNYLSIQYYAPDCSHLSTLSLKVPQFDVTIPRS